MDFNVSTSLDGDILVLVLSGDGSERNLKAISEQIVEVAAKSRAKKLLIDVRELQGRVGMAYIYSLVGETPLEAQALKSAIIDLKENESSYSFYELVAVSRGFHIRFFNDIPEAKLWLLSKSSDEASRPEKANHI
ncbi:MAG: hypothetical protein PHD74_04250 [Candidatus Krumholzibacteria bacterium]|nr:hypothetical protein [Candidatus Krumholzibacteria bacterium]